MPALTRRNPASESRSHPACPERRWTANAREVRTRRFLFLVDPLVRVVRSEAELGLQGALRLEKRTA